MHFNTKVREKYVMSDIIMIMCEADGELSKTGENLLIEALWLKMSIFSGWKETNTSEYKRSLFI